MAQNILSVEIPGKVILFGEHAVVYPSNQAVLWPVRSLRAQIKAEVIPDGASYMLNDDNKNASIDFGKIDDVLTNGRFTHQTYDTSGDISLLSIYKDSPLYIQFCCGLAHEYVRALKKPKPLKLTINSNIPVGGFGSSAAIAAGVIKAIVSANDLVLDQHTWFRLVMQAEKLQHGNPSGGDPAIATMRHPVIVAKRADGTVDIEQIEETASVRGAIKDTRLMYTGKPDQTTGEVVQFVASQIASKEIIRQIEFNTERAIKLIKNNQITAESWRMLINTNGELLEQLGVVPQKFLDVSQRVRASGGAIKISGGGATRGNSAGVFLGYGDDLDLFEVDQQFSLL